ncbi:hypothetical protein AB832_02015 [Flavobacteriaceae bacterium (ex Bugula neritina AB1)]|nr:hypothetical protein AB832_02015 [Flavobacteriaceae bacterium (ex Bugula neritina AB1)]
MIIKRILTGSETCSNSLLAYRMFGVTTNSEVAGTEALYSRLKERFIVSGGAVADEDINNIVGEKIDSRNS